MNIALNALSARAGAGISVFQTLMKALSEIDKKNRNYIFVASSQDSVIKSIPENFFKIEFKHCPQNPYLRVLWEQLIIPFYLGKYKIDTLYSVGNTTILAAPCKVLLFIENTNPFSKIIKNWTFKEKIRNQLLFFLGWFSSKKATRIRFCSKRSKEIIKKIYNIPDEKCFVLHHGLDFQLMDSDSNLDFPYKYILTVSVVAPHKNIETLINGYAILKKNKIYDGKLLIIGDTDCYPDYYNKLLRLIKNESMVNEIIFVGKVEYSKISSFYKNADLFVFPSLEETFGIPLIEALYNNMDTIVSDGNLYPDLFIPFNEIGKDYCSYFDPYSELNLVDKIKDVLINRQKRDSKNFVINNYNINAIAHYLLKEFENTYKS